MTQKSDAETDARARYRSAWAHQRRAGQSEREHYERAARSAFQRAFPDWPIVHAEADHVLRRHIVFAIHHKGFMDRTSPCEYVRVRRNSGATRVEVRGRWRPRHLS